MAVPINAGLIAAAGGRPGPERAPASSVAVYRLRKTTRHLRRYEFVTTLQPADFELEHWFG